MPFCQKGLSRLKMVALMPPNIDNITWYSPVDQNRKPSIFIINGMLRRFKEQQEANQVVVYQFYENGVKIYELKIKTDSFLNWIKNTNPK